MLRMPGLAMPVLGVLGLQNETMGWGTQTDDVEPFLPPGARFVALEDAGHFVHIEQPAKVAGRRARLPRRSTRAGTGWGPVGVGTPAPAQAPSDGHEALAGPGALCCHAAAPGSCLHELRAGAGRPLLLLHGLGERVPRRVPSYLDAWDGPVAALDFTGHGIVDDPPRRRIHGRGAAGRCRRRAPRAGTGDRPRPRARCLRRVAAGRRAAGSGARRDPRSMAPGILGGGNGPGSPLVSAIDPDALAPPDPFAVVRAGAGSPSARLRDELRSSRDAGLAARTAHRGVRGEPARVARSRRPRARGGRASAGRSVAAVLARRPATIRPAGHGQGIQGVHHARQRRRSRRGRDHRRRVHGRRQLARAEHLHADHRCGRQHRLQGPHDHAPAREPAGRVALRAVHHAT